MRMKQRYGIKEVSLFCRGACAHDRKRGSRRRRGSVVLMPSNVHVVEPEPEPELGVAVHVLRGVELSSGTDCLTE